MTRPTTREAPGPHLPVPWNPSFVTAFQALERGEADPAQQKLVLEWLMTATGCYDLSYRPGDTHATAFAEGKRFVGLQIRKMLVLVARAFTTEG